jgi:hypothetical protein
MEYSRCQRGPAAAGRASFAAALVALILFAPACGSPPGSGQPDDLDLPPEFTTPVAAAEEARLTIYWVGPRFEATGRVFRVIGARFEDNEGRPFAKVYYGASSEGGGGLDFTLTTYAQEGWGWAKTSETPKSQGATRQAITAAGSPAELYSIPVGRWTNRLVIVNAPDAVVVAPANAT